MIGAFLNALGILLGGLYGLAVRAPLSARAQNLFKLVLGVGTVAAGLVLIVTSLHGSIGSAVKQLLLAMLAVVLGQWTGKILQLQKLSNSIGRHAANLLSAAQKKPSSNLTDGPVAGTILFCAAPLGILGAMMDGLSGFFWLLALKAVMDGLATASFVKLFRWPAALAALPVFGLFYSLTIAVQMWGLPWLAGHDAAAILQTTIGLLTCVISVVVFEVRRVELNSYLPAIFFAPVLKLFVG